MTSYTKKEFQSRRHLFPISTSLILTFLAFGVFISQFLMSDIVTFAKQGDQMREGFPMFVQLGTLLRSGIWNGVDNGIFNGGAELFYKIHMSKYLPFVICAFLGSITNYELAYIFFYALHLFSALFFGQLLLTKFFYMKKEQSLLVVCSSVLVFCQNTWFAPFAAINALVYPILYFTISYLSDTRGGVLAAVTTSFLYVLAFTSGHPVYSSALAAIIFLVTLIYGLLYLKGQITVNACIIRTSLPAFCGGVFSFPYLLQIFHYTNNYSVAPDIMNMAVSLEHKLNPTDLLSAIFSSATVTSNSEQTRIYFIGIIWCLILMVIIRKKIVTHYMKRDERLFFFFLITLSVMSYIISLGDKTPMGVWFFSFVPVLGSVHLPVRYALIIMPLLFLALGLGLKHIKESPEEKKTVKSACCILVFLILLAVCMKNSTVMAQLFYDRDLLIFEALLYLSILYISLSIGLNSKKVLILSSLFMFFTSCQALYSLHEVTTHRYEFENRCIAYNQDSQETIDSFVDQLTPKMKYRYVEYDKQEPVPAVWPGNYSWYHLSRHNLTNYLGYSLHAYISRSYRDIAQIRSFDQFSWKYLLDTRADFIVTDQESINEDPDFYHFVIDESKAPKALNNQLIMYPLKKFIPGFFSNTDKLLEYSIDSDESFDNGYFYSPTLNENGVTYFETNDSSYFTIKFHSSSDTSISFLPFADQYYEYYIDENKFTPVIHNGVAYFDVGSGEHTIEIRYVNKFECIVIGVFFLYYLLTAVCGVILLIKNKLIISS